MSIARRLAAIGFGRQLYTFTGGILPPEISFTRASAGWRFNSAGLLVSEATDVARFQYDPATLAARGLLIEDASTGVTTRTDAFDNAAWTKVRASVTANAVTGPDGTTSGDSLIEDLTANNTHDVRQLCSYVSGTTYVHSIIAKANTRSRIYIQLNAGPFGTTKNTWFNLAGGTVGTTAAGVTAFIQSLGNGWYRCVCIATATASSSATWLVSMTTADNSAAYNGDGASSIYIYGGNLQIGDALTSYVQADASPVVRAADTALITNTQVLGDQCYILKARTPRKISGGAVNVLLQVDDGTNNNNRRIVYGTDGRIHVIATSGGVDQCDLDLGAVAADTDFGVAARFAENNFAASLNGGTVVVDSAGVNPTGLTTARLGRRSDGYAWNSTIRSLESRRQASDGDLRALAA